MLNDQPEGLGANHAVAPATARTRTGDHNACSDTASAEKADAWAVPTIAFETGERSEPVAVRTIKLQPAATTFRCRHICQSASRRVRVQAQLINVMSFDVITLRNGKDSHCQVNASDAWDSNDWSCN
jgi:hypothetical protein